MSPYKESRFKSYRAFTWLMITGVLVLLPQSVQATAMVKSNVAITNFEITAFPGTVEFSDPWTLNTFAQASGSGERSQNSDINTGGVSTVSASVGLANARGFASAPKLITSASSEISISGSQTAQARSEAFGLLFNDFTISGGTGPVNVIFSIDIEGNLHVFNAHTRAIVSLELDGNPIPLPPDFDLILDGSDDKPHDKPIDKSESITLSLLFGQSYFVLAQVDSESSAINKVALPATIILMPTSLVVLACLGRKRNTKEKAHVVKS